MLTHDQTLRECGKTLIMAKESRESKDQIQHDIEQCVDQWVKLVHCDDILGFVFPQTPSHKPIVVTRLLMMEAKTKQSKPKTTKELMSDQILAYVSKKVIEACQTCRAQKKDVAWTWPVIEMYINQYYEETKELKAKSKGGADDRDAGNQQPRIRLSTTTPSGSQTSSLQTPEADTYVVVTFPISDTILQRMYNLLMDLDQIKETRKIVSHENAKFKESIVRNILDQHQRQQPASSQLAPPSSKASTLSSPSQSVPSSSSSQTPQSSKLPTKIGLPELKYDESIAIERPKNKEPVQIEFKAKIKPVYTATHVTKDVYLNTLRVKHMQAKTEFETLLTTPLTRSIKKHPFYLFLHKELLQCREQMFRSTHPDAPLQRVDLKVGLKRKRVLVE